MKDRLRKRRQSMRIPERYRIIPDSSKYDPDGWPKGHRPTWTGTLRRSAKTGMLYRDTMGLGCYDPESGTSSVVAWWRLEEEGA